MNIKNKQKWIEIDENSRMQIGEYNNSQEILEYLLHYL